MNKIKGFIKKMFVDYEKTYIVKFSKERKHVNSISWYLVVFLVLMILGRILTQVAKESTMLRTFGELSNLFDTLVVLALFLNIYNVLKFILKHIDEDIDLRFRTDNNLRVFCENNNFVEREKEKEIKYDSQGRKQYKDITRLLYYPDVAFALDEEYLIISFRLDGHKYSKQYDDLSEQLANMMVLDFDNMKIQQGCAVYTFRRKALKRESVKDIVEDDLNVIQNSVLLSDRYTWNFRKSPHGLIGGITGSGKTYLLAYFIIIFIRLNVGFKIVDPKRADLSYLEKYFGEENVMFDTNKVLRMLRESCELIDERMSNFKKRPDYAFGKDYFDYNVKAEFIIFDEAAAFVALLDKKQKLEFDKYVSKIILQGRQAGIFIIFVMQRPDTNFLDGALRDQLGLRIALSKMSADGYKMIFGKIEKDLVSQDGSGFVMDSSMIEPEEFYSPYMNIDFISKLEELIGYVSLKK